MNKCTKMHSAKENLVRNLSNSIYERYEKKYILTTLQYEKMIAFLADKTEENKYSKAQIGSLYYDTPDYRLIRASIEKPVYKEKLRVRSYGIPRDNTPSFIELKKKYRRVVYKRRLSLPYKDATHFINMQDDGNCNQIGKEILAFCRTYASLHPAMICFCDRYAITGIEDLELRLTFDKNIISRNTDLDLRKGAFGIRILDKDFYLMEIKVPGVIPLWLAKALDEFNIYPNSFSKYGTAYKKIIF